MEIQNLTPHAVTIFDNDGKTILATVRPSGDVARVTMSRTQTDSVGSIPVFVSTAGDVTGLPPAGNGTVFIVSALVRLAVPTRKDVFSPGELIRNDQGQPVGCKGLEANA